jgi:hypothetical protein
LFSIHPTVSKILQVHLVIEEEISEILKIQTKNFSQIERLSFSNKLCVFKALSFWRPDAYPFKLIEEINKLRNTVSHEAWHRASAKLEQRMENFRKLLSVCEFFRREQVSNLDHGSLCMVAAGWICGLLNRERKRLSEDLENRKAVPRLPVIPADFDPHFVGQQSTTKAMTKKQIADQIRGFRDEHGTANKYAAIANDGDVLGQYATDCGWNVDKAIAAAADQPASFTDWAEKARTT